MSKTRSDWLREQNGFNRGILSNSAKPSQTPKLTIEAAEAALRPGATTIELEEAIAQTFLSMLPESSAWR